MPDRNLSKEKLLGEIKKHRRRIMTLEKIYDKAKQELFSSEKKWEHTFDSITEFV